MRASHNFPVQVNKMFIKVSLVLVLVLELGKCAQYPQHPDLVTDVPMVDCGSEHGTLTHLVIDPPCGPVNCTFKRGEKITIYAHILPRISSPNIRVQMHQIDPNFGFSTMLLPEFNPCGHHNVTCPMEASKIIYSQVEGKFPPATPPWSVNLKVLVMSEDWKTMVCGSVKMIVV